MGYRQSIHYKRVTVGLDLKEGLIKSWKIPQGLESPSLWATCGVAEATPFRNEDLIRGSLKAESPAVGRGFL